MMARITNSHEKRWKYAPSASSDQRRIDHFGDHWASTTAATCWRSKTTKSGDYLLYKSDTALDRITFVYQYIKERTSFHFIIIYKSQDNICYQKSKKHGAAMLFTLDKGPELF
jgi:hypothetical protein